MHVFSPFILVQLQYSLHMPLHRLFYVDIIQLLYFKYFFWYKFLKGIYFNQIISNFWPVGVITSSSMLILLIEVSKCKHDTQSKKVFQSIQLKWQLQLYYFFRRTCKLSGSLSVLWIVIAFEFNTKNKTRSWQHKAECVVFSRK